MAKRTVDALNGVDAVVSAASGVQGKLDDEIQITMLGAGQEVGRSCCLIKHRGRTIVCDAGAHPGNTGLAALPFVDEVDWSTVDALLITHFHIDHAASLPYIMEKTTFKEGKGKVYMTRATKAIYNIVMRDFVKISLNTANDEDGLQEKDRTFDEEDLRRSFESIEAVNFLEEVSVLSTANSSTSIRFTSYHAGHVLGAAMFLIEIAGARILYTGDYSVEEDRHLITASLPNWGRPPDVMICESTFGRGNLPPRHQQEADLLANVANILKRGGRVLMPETAIGRVQELLLILDEHWSKRQDLQQYPIYFVGGNGTRGMAVYRQHSNSLNASIQARVARGDNPFDFRKNGFVREVKGINKKDRFDDSKPCVVIASPGMLQYGVSRELLEKWAPDSKNGLILCGYSIEGTLARDMQHEPDSFEALFGGRKIIRRMTVNYISFAAHVDYQQNSAFIEQVKPSHLVLVHGSRQNVFELKDALKERFKRNQQDVQIYTPSNVRDRLRIQLSSTRVAKAIGSLAEHPPKPGSVISGLLVAKDGSYTLMAPTDLQEYTGLSTTTIRQRQLINLDVGWELVRWHVEGMYGSVETGLDREGYPTMRVMRTVDIKQTSEREVTLEWMGGSTNDMVADSVLALLMGVDTSPASVKKTMHSHSHPHADRDHAEDAEEEVPVQIERLMTFLQSQFGSVEYIEEELPVKEEEEDRPIVVKADPDEDLPFVKEENDIHASKRPVGTAAAVQSRAKPPLIRIKVDGESAEIALSDLTVHTSSDALRQRVESTLRIAVRTVTPFGGGHSRPFLKGADGVKRVAIAA